MLRYMPMSNETFYLHSVNLTLSSSHSLSVIRKSFLDNNNNTIMKLGELIDSFDLKAGRVEQPPPLLLTPLQAIKHDQHGQIQCENILIVPRKSRFCIWKNLIVDQYDRIRTHGCSLGLQDFHACFVVIVMEYLSEMVDSSSYMEIVQIKSVSPLHRALSVSLSTISWVGYAPFTGCSVK